MKKIKNLLIVLISIVLFNACGKDGAAGPAGATGASGPTGSAGSQGATGPSGTANISTANYTVLMSEWVDGGNGSYSSVRSDAAITDASNDGVMAYFYDGSEYWGLPINNYWVTPDNLYFHYSNGSITFGYDAAAVPTTDAHFKVVTIPPAIRKLHPNTNWKNYNEAMKVLGMISN